MARVVAQTRSGSWRRSLAPATANCAPLPRMWRRTRIEPVSAWPRPRYKRQNGTPTASKTSRDFGRLEVGFSSHSPYGITAQILMGAHDEGQSSRQNASTIRVRTTDAEPASNILPASRSGPSSVSLFNLLRFVALRWWRWRRRPTVRSLHFDDIPAVIGSPVPWWRRRWCGRLLITHLSISSSQERADTLFPTIALIAATVSHRGEFRAV